jgi:hypothetical protein
MNPTTITEPSAVANRAKTTNTTTLEADAKILQGVTVFGKKTVGTLSLTNTSLSFTDTSGTNIFQFIPSDIKSLTVTSVTLKIHLNSGKRYIISFGDSAEAFAKSALLLAPATTMGRLYPAEKKSGRDVWLSTLKQRGYTTNDAGVMKQAKLGLIIFFVAIAPLLLILSIVVAASSGK